MEETACLFGGKKGGRGRLNAKIQRGSTPEPGFREARFPLPLGEREKKRPSLPEEERGKQRKVS